MKIFYLLPAIILCLNTVCQANETVFYALRYQTSDRMTPPAYTLESLKRNYQKIDILIPQAYSITADGEISKSIEPEIFEFAKAHAMKIMPLVTNSKFDKDIAHQFLLDKNVQTKSINRLLELTKQHHFYGMQLDFEMVDIADRDLLTSFYEAAANTFHAAGFKISFAVAPIVTDQPVSLFYKKIYKNWEGAYDFKALGVAGDFISIMAYNQHGGRTTPGPTASLPWVEQCVKYALQFVPANKISIGIADYSTHWYTGHEIINQEEKVAVNSRAYNYENIMKIIKSERAHLIWNKQSATHYAIFEKNWLNEYIFIEDVKSFKYKLELVKKYQLRGISVFDLGTEDPGIWKML